MANNQESQVATEGSMDMRIGKDHQSIVEDPFQQGFRSQFGNENRKKRGSVASRFDKLSAESSGSFSNHPAADSFTARLAADDIELANLPREGLPIAAAHTAGDLAAPPVRRNWLVRILTKKFNEDDWRQPLIVEILKVAFLLGVILGGIFLIVYMVIVRVPSN